MSAFKNILTGKAIKGRKPKNKRAAAAVAQLGRKKVTGNFARLEKKYGKGAAINAFQNAKRAHEAGK